MENSPTLGAVASESSRSNQTVLSATGSVEATRCMRFIGALFSHAGSPHHGTWLFYAGQARPALEELAMLGLVQKMLGTERGFAWRLSDAGMQKISAFTS